MDKRALVIGGGVAGIEAAKEKGRKSVLFRIQTGADQPRFVPLEIAP